MTTRQQAESALVRKKSMQAANDKHLVQARADVEAWLDQVAFAIHREKLYLEDKGDIADGEISVPYDLLQQAIARLRAAQAHRDQLKRDIEDLLADLADEEIWKDSAVTSVPAG